MSSAILKKHGDNLELSLEGILNVSGVSELSTLAQNLIDFSIDNQIDCRNLKSCDSAGLALMVSWLKSAKINGGNLIFSNLSTQIDSFVELMGLTKLFSGHENE